MKHRIGFALVDEFSKVPRRKETILSGRLFSLVHGTHRIKVVLVSPEREIKRAAKDRPVFIHARRGKTIVLQLV